MAICRVVKGRIREVQVPSFKSGKTDVSGSHTYYILQKLLTTFNEESTFDLPPGIVLVPQLTTRDQYENEDDIVCLSEGEDNLAEDNKPSGTALSGWICPSLVAWTSDTPVYDAPKKFGETCLLEDVGGVGYLGPVQPKELF